MIQSQKEMEMPKWLKEATKETKEFQIKNILKDSLYYPSSAFDADPIKNLSGNCYSFIHVDYGYDEERLDEEIKEQGFKGYHKILSRSISKEELSPNGWQMQELTLSEQRRASKAPFFRKPKPFAKWFIYEKDKGQPKEHGAERFSLLHICADGAATYQALYYTNKTHPKYLALIQPGHGFGGNWTNFFNEKEILARTVLKNKSGTPEAILYGGWGRKECGEMYKKPCWSKYPKLECFLQKTKHIIGLWKKE